MGNKDTQQPHHLPELLSEIRVAFRTEVVTVFMWFGVGTSLPLIFTRWARMRVVSEFFLSITKDALIGLLCAFAYLIYCAHGAIKKRDLENIAALKDEIEKLRPAPTPLIAFKNYLEKKITYAQDLAAATTPENIKIKATDIWKWEESLILAIKSSLGEDEVQVLLGQQPQIFKRPNNWFDSEGHWIVYRAYGLSGANVASFREDIYRVMAYVEALSNRTTSNSLLKTFNPGDLGLYIP